MTASVPTTSIASLLRPQMSFSLSHFPAENPDLVDAVLLAAGKALHIANAFESKCRFVLRYFRLRGFYEANPSGDYDEAMAIVLRDKMLAKTIEEMGGFPIITPTDVKALEDAKDARNFIAHEGAAFGRIWEATERGLYLHLELLRAEVGKLARGDLIASRWTYFIEEKSAYSHSMDNYPDQIDAWIFGWWDGSIPAAPPKLSLNERLRRALEMPPAE